MRCPSPGPPVDEASRACLHALKATLAALPVTQEFQASGTAVLMPREPPPQAGSTFVQDSVARTHSGSLLAFYAIRAPFPPGRVRVGPGPSVGLSWTEGRTSRRSCVRISPPASPRTRSIPLAQAGSWYRLSGPGRRHRHGRLVRLPADGSVRKRGRPDEPSGLAPAATCWSWAHLVGGPDFAVGRGGFPTTENAFLAQSSGIRRIDRCSPFCSRSHRRYPLRSGRGPAGDEDRRERRSAPPRT